MSTSDDELVQWIEELVNVPEKPIRNPFLDILADIKRELRENNGEDNEPSE